MIVYDETIVNTDHSKAFYAFLKVLNFNLLKILERNLVIRAGLPEKLVDILMKNALKLFSPITVFPMKYCVSYTGADCNSSEVIVLSTHITTRGNTEGYAITHTIPYRTS